MRVVVEGVGDSRIPASYVIVYSGIERWTL